MSEKAENLAQWFEGLAKTADMDAFGREPITGIGAEACREVAGYIRSQAERIRVLETALEPFATMDKVMRRYEGNGYPKIDDARPYQGGAAWADKDGNIRFVTNGDFARARTAMEPRNG